MFTGIIEQMGTVTALVDGPESRRLSIEGGAWPPDPKAGESIAVNGCCLTLASSGAGTLEFDVIPQTLSRTTLGGWQVGRRVNLERSATPSTLLGGHLVHGHVDATGRVRALSRSGEWRLTIVAPAEVAPFLMPRGSIAVDGVSLTIAAVNGSDFEVCLIPETLARTTLGVLREGSLCNLEADSIAKMVDAAVRHRLGRRASG
ncbi:MAG: riboflavin synthase [Phycisphaeraceae bacterium]|nr:riboflavin synthase [Phycisphaeraceae bacterium]